MDRPKKNRKKKRGGIPVRVQAGQGPKSNTSTQSLSNTNGNGKLDSLLTWVNEQCEKKTGRQSVRVPDGYKAFRDKSEKEASVHISHNGKDRVLAFDLGRGKEGTKPFIESVGLKMEQLFLKNYLANGHAPTNGHGSFNSKTNDRKVYPTFEAVKAAFQSFQERKLKHSIGTFTKYWDYEDDSTWFRIARWDSKKYGKTLVPIVKVKNGWTIGGVPESNRPLLDLESVNDADTIFVTEGEKAKDALESLGVVVTCSSFGANAADKTDWSPLSGKKEVYIVPDNDKPGERFAEDVISLLSRLPKPPKVVKIIRLPNLPDGGDAADWVKAGGTKKQLTALVKKAAAVKPSQNSLSSLNSSVGWPTPDPIVFHGLAGDITRELDPYTEADPIAILVHLLSAFGIYIGPGPHFQITNDHHSAKLFPILIGRTAKGRKGTAANSVKEIMRRVDANWVEKCWISGLSTGEGLIKHLESQDDDHKRVFVMEPEFGSMLNAANRLTNTLTGTVRQLWDDNKVNVLTRADPLVATNLHVAINGHATSEELVERLTEMDCKNGFGNRFMFVGVSRSKYLSNGAIPPDSLMERLASQVKSAARLARKVKRMNRDEEAQSLWDSVYATLSDEKPGIVGALLSRADPYVVRLSLVYALLDKSSVINSTVRGSEWIQAIAA